tara:strand:+ start:2763 stop:3797 length:1035 start_codon:yes stop_codon:yes gene_type:complete
MRPNPSLILFLLAVFSTTAALYSINISEDYQRTTANDVQVFPRLNAKPEAAKVLVIETGGLKLKFKQNKDSVWVAEDKFKYPASSKLIQKVISQLADMRKIAVKTRMPSRFNQIGVEPYQQADANSVFVKLKAADGEILAESIFGAQFRRNNIGVAEGTFIRHPKEQQAWLASGSIDIPSDLLSWLDTRILNIGSNEIKKIKLWDKLGRTAVVVRSNDGGRFIYQNRDGIGYLDREIAKNLFESLTKLSFVDVLPRKISEKWQSILNFEVEAYSGPKIAGQLFRGDSRKILQFSIEENALKKIALRGLADTIAYNELNKWSYFIPSWQADRFLEGLKVIEGGLQ